MIDFTTVVGVDQTHLEELRLVWPTWVRFRSEILDHPLLLICDGSQSQAEWESRLLFLEHPNRRIVLWDLPGVEQREKMLTGLVCVPGNYVHTPWYLKLDTDVVATRRTEWVDSEWFDSEKEIPDPVLVAPAWGYSKPADVIERLNRWGDGHPELSSHSRVDVETSANWSLVSHPRIIGWCCFAKTAWTQQVASFCGGRLPVPSQDTYLWYCAVRRGDPVRRVNMKRKGWMHISNVSRLKQVCGEILGHATRSLSSPRTPSLVDSSKTSHHSTQLIELIGCLKKENLRGAEVGVASGRTSAALLTAFAGLSLALVDTWSASDPNSTYYRCGDKMARQSNQQHLIAMEQAHKCTEFAANRRQVCQGRSVEIAKDFEDDSLDFVFLDADPSYDSILADLYAWWPKLRIGGLLCGHDYGHPRDRKGMWGISRAVQTFCKTHGLDAQLHRSTIWSILRPAQKKSAPRPELSDQDDVGIVYLLTGTAHAARLVVSIASLRRYYRGRITVYTTHPQSHVIGQLCASDSRLAVEHRRFPYIAAGSNSSFLTKVALLPHSPYFVTAYLDADTLVDGDISRLFEVTADIPFVATQFSNWLADGPIVGKRINRWRNVRQDLFPADAFRNLIEGALQPIPAVNGGVFGFRRDAGILNPWFDLSLAGKDTFICDEIALQLLLPQFAHTVLDCRYNCSPLRATSKQDVRIWHFHGEKHVCRSAARRIWLPLYEECLRENLAQLAEWAPGGDPSLTSFLATTDQALTALPSIDPV